MAERAIKKKRGDLRVTIVRPSIIISNYAEPYEGWIDTLAASGGIVMAASLGIMHFFHGLNTSILDMIPCDFVSNQVLVQTAQTAMEPKSVLNVVHSATATNPVKLAFMVRTVLDYCKYNPWFSKIQQQWFVLVPDKQLWRLSLKATEDVPIWFGKTYAAVSGDVKLASQFD